LADCHLTCLFLSFLVYLFCSMFLSVLFCFSLCPFNSLFCLLCFICLSVFSILFCSISLFYCVLFSLSVLPVLSLSRYVYASLCIIYQYQTTNYLLWCESVSVSPSDGAVIGVRGEVGVRYILALTVVPRDQ